MDPNALPDPKAALIGALSRMTDAQYDRALDSLKAAGRAGAIAAVTLIGGLAPILAALAAPGPDSPGGIP